MNAHAKDPTAQQKFLYVTYIRSTCEKVWEALTQPEFTRQYWYGMSLESDWRKGSAWKMVSEKGTITDDGTVLESRRPHHMVWLWQHRWKPEIVAEGGEARCTFDLEQEGPLVKLTIVHEGLPKLIEAVSGGWPRILASMKSLLETGDPLPNTREAKPGT